MCLPLLLSNIISSLANLPPPLYYNISEDTKEAHEERKDAMLLALAELKQVRDTMAGLLSENEEIEQEAAFFDPLNATSAN